MPVALRFSLPLIAASLPLGVLLLAPALCAQSRLGPAPRVVRPQSMTTPRSAAAPQTTGGWVDISDREAVRQFFLSTYVPIQNFPEGWTGNLATGDAGDTSAAYKGAVITMINFFRSLAGVSPGVTIDLVTSAKDQKAALMYAANQNLSHTPPTTWIDYTADGAEAAGKSNICLDTTLPQKPGCIENYIDDSDPGNVIVGHRRWILYPQTTRMGTGDIPPGDQTHRYGANAVWVINEDEVFGPRPATREQFVAWPPPGYVPQQLIFSRWSFSYAEANFGGASVTMTRNGSAVPLVLHSPVTGAGENTVTWDADNGVTTAQQNAVTLAADVTTHVTVSNVIINGVAKEFSYDVIAFDPTQASTRTISHIAVGAGWRTTVILINTGTQAANFELKFWNEQGSPLVLDLGSDGMTADLTGTLQPGVAHFIRTASTGVNLIPGWAELNAPQDIDGNSIFGLQVAGHGDSEAAVPLSPNGGTELYIPFDYTTGYSTGIAFADPGHQAATLTAAILDDADASIPASNMIQVPARGHYADVLAAKFPAVVGKRGAAHFSANTNIFGLGIRANGAAFTSIDALSGVTSATKTIPHIADGGGWKTTFLLVCTDSHASNFTLKFWDEQGNPLTLPLGADGTVASLTGTIQPGELRVVKTANTAAQLTTGWAELSGLTGAIGGTAIFALQSPGHSDSEAAVPFSTAASTNLFMPYDYSPGYSTAIAFTNTGSTAALVTATFTDDGGHLKGTGQITVPAHGHNSAILGGLAPAIVGTRGTVALVSNVAIFGLGIRANGGAFTSLKVIAK